MKLTAMLVTLCVTAIALGGCTDNPPEAGTQNGKVREFLLVIPPGSGNNVELYEKNDGSKMKVVAIPFQSLDQEEAAIPGPQIEVDEGDTVVIRVQNQNALTHTLHLHGAIAPWAEDGADYLTQMPIPPGGEQTYTFKDVKAGTYFYHCHMDGAHHLDLGMYGAFIVKERAPPVKADRDYVLLLDEWDNCHVHGNTDPVTGAEQNGEFTDRADCMERFLQDYLAQNQLGNAAAGTASPYTNSTICPQLVPSPGDPSEVTKAKERAARSLGCGGAHGHGNPPPQQEPRKWWPETGPVYSPEYNTYLINGKAFPDTAALPVKEGETVRLRFINVGAQMHSMHLHGHPMRVIARDGYLLDSPYTVDTLGIMPGERYDVIVEMTNPGWWMLQDHAGAGLTNDDQSPGGMMTCIAYDGFHDVDAFGFKRALDCNTAAIKVLGAGHHG